jgi:hypothetical protein
MTGAAYTGGRGPASPPYDPLRFCIFTTVALIAWVLGAPAAVMLMSGLGLWAYWRAWRGGLRETRCFLRDPRLAMAYLLAAFALGAAFLVAGSLRAA